MQLRQYQKDAISALWKFWRENPKGAPLIVAPTGSGKSAIIGAICQTINDQRPAYRILIVSHRAEIISQNSRAISKFLNGVPIGIWSAGLGQKTLRKITCANIQSIFRKDLPPFELLIIDECHLISSKSTSMYGKLIEKSVKANPDLKICGMTATPFRLDQGSLIGGLFTDICYDIELTRLIDEGFLSPAISMPAAKIDFSNVEKSGYDYKQAAVEEKMFPFVEEHCEAIKDISVRRNHILTFCSGVKHANAISDTLEEIGVRNAVITGETLQYERDIKLNKFRSGETKVLINIEVLTTGFDMPQIDCIVLLRATQSCGLYVQMIGRGMRIAEGKKDCLVLDFGSNISRFGPIDCIKVGRKNKKDKLEIGKAPSKTCESCGCVVALRTLVCPNCGAEFSIESTKLQALPEKAPVLSAPEIWEVQNHEYKRHNKTDKPPSFRIGFKGREIWQIASDFLCFEHGGFATDMARRKWKSYGGLHPAPQTTDEAINRREELINPAQIEVKREGKYYRIIKLLGKKEEEPKDYYQEKYNF